MMSSGGYLNYLKHDNELLPLSIMSSHMYCLNISGINIAQLSQYHSMLCIIFRTNAKTFHCSRFDIIIHVPDGGSLQ